MKIFITGFFLILAVIALCFQLWLTPQITIVYILFSILFSYIVASIIGLIFSSQKWKIHKLARRVFVFVWSISGVFLVLIGAFVYQQNYNNPAQLSNVVLENSAGQKVVFVKMSHIATQNFLQKKKDSIENLANSGYKIMIEGVGSGSQDSANRFNAMMWFDMVGRGYGDFAEILGLAEQDINLYENIEKDKLVHVDISLDDLMGILGQENIENGVLGGQNIQAEIEAIKKQFLSLNSREEILIRQLLHAVLNFYFKRIENVVIPSDLTSASLTDSEKFLSIILHKRNDPVIEYINNHPNENIAIVYGALHFQGVFEGLKKKDDTWKILSLEAFSPFK